MRVGVISQTYAPEPGAARQATIIADSLAALGHRVRVVTGFPNYPEGRLFPGWTMRAHLHDRVHGIAVHRTALYPNHGTAALPRMLHYASWAATAAPAGWHDLGGADVNLVFGSPATTAIPGAAARLRGAPFVLYLQDLWPDSVLTSGILSGGQEAVRKLLNAYCNASYRMAAHLVVLAPTMKTLLVERGVPAGKISVLPNWADEATFHPAPADATLRARWGLSRPHLVVYAGNLGIFQQLDALLDAAERLRHRDDIGFAIIGSGVRADAVAARAADLPNVALVPPQPPAAMAGWMALGDLHYVALPDLPHLRGTIPSKTQATLSAGRALLAAAPGDTNDLVRSAGAGWTVPRAEGRLLADAISAAVADPAEIERRAAQGLHYYREELCAARAARRLTMILRAAARPGARS